MAQTSGWYYPQLSNRKSLPFWALWIRIWWEAIFKHTQFSASSMRMETLLLTEPINLTLQESSFEPRILLQILFVFDSGRYTLQWRIYTSMVNIIIREFVQSSFIRENVGLSSISFLAWKWLWYYREKKNSQCLKMQSRKRLKRKIRKRNMVIGCC